MSRMKRVLWLVAFALPIGPSSAQHVETSQVPLLEVLPAVPAIYVWSDDAPALVETLVELNSLELESLAKVLDYPLDWTQDRAAFNQRHHDDRFEALEMLDELVDPELFDGQAMWLRHLRRPPDKRDVFVAHSTAGRERFREIILTLNRLFDPNVQPRKQREEQPQDDIENPSHTLGDDESFPSIKVEALGYLPGVWAYEEDWFLWAQREEDLVEVWSYLNGDNRSQFPLGESRAFETVFRKLAAQPVGDPVASFYVPAESWPAISAWGLGMNQTNFAGIYSPVWQAMVHDCQGFGGHVSWHSPESDQERSSLAFDTFLLIPEPRTAVLASATAKQDFDFDLPFLPERIGTFFQVAADGQQLATGLDEIPERTERIPAELRQLRVKFLGDVPPTVNTPASIKERIFEYKPDELRLVAPLVRPIDRFVYIRGEVDPKRFDPTFARFDPVLFLHTPEHADAVSAIDEYMNGDVSLTIHKSLYEKLDWQKLTIEEDRETTWIASRESREDRVSQLEQWLDATTASFEEQRGRFQNDPEGLKKFDQSLEESMAFFMRSTVTPRFEATEAFWLARDGWFLPHPVSSIYEESLESTDSVSEHPQIAELRDDIDFLNKSHELSEHPFGLVAVWGSHIKIAYGVTDGSREDGQPYDMTKYYYPYGEKGTDERIGRAITQQRKFQFKASMLDRLDRIVALIHDEQHGFHITGAVFGTR